MRLRILPRLILGEQVETVHGTVVELEIRDDRRIAQVVRCVCKSARKKTELSTTKPHVHVNYIIVRCLLNANDNDDKILILHVLRKITRIATLAAKEKKV